LLADRGGASVVGHEALALALGHEPLASILRDTGTTADVGEAIDSKDRVARWLREEWNEVRNGNRGRGLSRIQLADAAMTMLESCQPPDRPGADLLGLVQELLGVDVHRANFAASCGKLEYCAAIEALAECRYGEGRLSDGELARRCGVSRVTVRNWRRLLTYQGLLEDARAVCTEPKPEG
jgi:hypothetical protein